MKALVEARDTANDARCGRHIACSGADGQPGAVQEKLDAERKKRKRAELEESQRQEREIAAQIERARQVELARDTSGEGRGSGAERGAAAADGPVRMQLAAGVAPAVAGAGQERGKTGAGAAMFADDKVGNAAAAGVAGGARKASAVRPVACARFAAPLRCQLFVRARARFRARCCHELLLQSGLSVSNVYHLHA